MDEGDKKRLAGFHHTVSEQLNARLSESPKFFGLLVAIATGYGYVLMAQPDKGELFLLVSVVSWASVLWAMWYLAALGYAFRFLQNIQHCVEYQLGWNPQFVPKPEHGRHTGSPPWPTKTPIDCFWLLPGIYHAHAGGLFVLLAIVCAEMGVYGHRHLSWCLCSAVAIPLVTGAIGTTWFFWISRHYLRKFAEKYRDPQKDDG